MRYPLQPVSNRPTRLRHAPPLPLPSSPTYPLIRSGPLPSPSIIPLQLNPSSQDINIKRILHSLVEQGKPVPPSPGEHPEEYNSMPPLPSSASSLREMNSPGIKHYRNFFFFIHSHHAANASANNFSKFGTPNPVTGSQPSVAFQLAYGMMLPPTTGAPVWPLMPLQPTLWPPVISVRPARPTVYTNVSLALDTSDWPWDSATYATDSGSRGPVFRL